MAQTTEKEIKDLALLEAGITEFENGNIGVAERLLVQVVATEPVGYVNEYVSEGRRYIKFWTEEDYAYFVSRLPEDSDPSEIFWVPNIYPRAMFFLAMISRLKKNIPAARAYLFAALKLEPNQPEIYLELARVFAELQDQDQVFKAYASVLGFKQEVRSDLQAIALRGLGHMFTDVGNLDEATRMFQLSLIVEPENEFAQQGLAYIEQLRAAVAQKEAKSDSKSRKWWQIGKR